MEPNPLITAFGFLYTCGALLDLFAPFIYIPFFLIALVVTLIKKPKEYKIVKRHSEYVWKKRFFTVKNMVKYNLFSLAFIAVAIGYAFLFRHLGLC